MKEIHEIRSRLTFILCHNMTLSQTLHTTSIYSRQRSLPRSMSNSGSAGPGFDIRPGRKFVKVLNFKLSQAFTAGVTTFAKHFFRAIRLWSQPVVVSAKLPRMRRRQEMENFQHSGHPSIRDQPHCTLSLNQPIAYSHEKNQSEFASQTIYIDSSQSLSVSGEDCLNQEL